MATVAPSSTFESRKRPAPDLVSLITMLALSAVGLVMVYSASRVLLIEQGLDPGTTLRRQLIWVAAGLVAYLIGAVLDYREFRHFTPWLYAATLALLVVVLFMPVTAGAQRWIPLGSFQVQPSELAKAAMILVLAAVLAPARDEGMRWPRLLFALALVTIPAFLIFRQPDLGTMLVFGFIAVIMLFAAGATFRQITALVLAGAAGFYGVLKLQLLRDYQIDRLTSFLDPAADPLDTGYNLLQSQRAIGSGQLFGRGLFEGTQTNLSFVPAQPTDFIFTAIGEQLGFVGGAIVLAGFAVLLVRLVIIAAASRDRYGSLITVGVAALLAFHVFVNVGMTIGIMPVTGLPLPFMSAGGSAYMTMAFLLGVTNSVWIRRSPVPGETFRDLVV